MLGRFIKASLGRRWSLVAALLAGVLTGMLVGCSTPQERYRVLSYFFDGVPDPDAPAIVATTQATDETQVVTAAVIVSRHKPYIDKNCNACHRGANGEVQEFEQAYEACVHCHKKVPTDHALMHGPVARAVCKFCHEPHESRQPALLKDSPIKVCTQCHEQQLLGNVPIEHNDGVTSCLQCHFGHGGDKQFFLKPATPAATRPTTSPASRPAAASDGAPPASQPANVVSESTLEPESAGELAP